MFWTVMNDYCYVMDLVLEQFNLKIARQICNIIK